MTKQKKSNALLDLLFNIAIPAIILSKFSNNEYLGEVNGFIISLSFPIIYGLFSFYKSKKINIFSALGLINVLLTGGIGLMRLDKNWLVIKETAIPLFIGIYIIISQHTKYPLVKIILQHALDFKKITQGFSEKSSISEFESMLRFVSKAMAATFFLSAMLNCALAIYILKGEPGTETFNVSLGKMTALSFPVIAIPCMIVSGFIFFYIFNTIKNKTDLEWESIIKK